MINSVWVTWPSLVKFGSLGVAAAALVIGLERGELLENNMFSTEDFDQANEDIVCDERSLTARTEDGTCNILENPAEGSVYMRFGRNVDLESVKTALTVTQVHPNFSSGTISVDPGRLNIQEDDLLIAW